MEPPGDSKRQTTMRTMAVVAMVTLATCSAAACGSADDAQTGAPASTTEVTAVAASGPEPSPDATAELRTVAAWDDDRDPRWEAIGMRSPIDITPTDDTHPIAAVAWTEAYDGSVIDQVDATPGCDGRCVNDVEAWAADQVAAAPLATVAEEEFCGSCGEAGRLSFVTVGHEEYSLVERHDLEAVIGEIDTPYEVMVALGEPARVRPDDDGWRAVLHRVLSDCAPFIDEYTMWSTLR